jgi:hypothetical protein
MKKDRKSKDQHTKQKRQTSEEQQGQKQDGTDGKRDGDVGGESTNHITEGQGTVRNQNDKAAKDEIARGILMKANHPVSNR